MKRGWLVSLGLVLIAIHALTVRAVAAPRAEEARPRAGEGKDSLPASTPTPQPIVPTPEPTPVVMISMALSHAEDDGNLDRPVAAPLSRAGSGSEEEAFLQRQGALSLEQSYALDQAAKKYVADTEAKAIEVARSLKYVPNDGHPASMCGPLTIAILRDAGLIDPYLDLGDFWLLNPRTLPDQRLLEEAFPKERYLWFTETRAVDEIDFGASPLYAGDFLYVYAGQGGNFEHVLAVTRVDPQGRAFSVTNLNTEHGYVIQERLLYDPERPGEGLFYEWTDRRNRDLGLTGFGGFQLWRPISAPGAKDQADPLLAQKIDAILVGAGGHWNVLVKTVGGEVAYARRADERLHPASVIKVPLAMLFLKAVEAQGIEDLEGYLAVRGAAGRSFAQLLRAMLVKSEEEATEALLRWTTSRLNVDSVLREWGATQTTFLPRRSTVRDLGKLLEGLYGGDLVSHEARAIILELMAEYTPSDDSRIGVIRNTIPEAQIYNKRGSLAGDGVVIVGDAGIVQTPEVTTIVVILGSPGGRGEAQVTYERLDAVTGEVAREVASHIAEWRTATRDEAEPAMEAAAVTQPGNPSTKAHVGLGRLGRATVGGHGSRAGIHGAWTARPMNALHEMTVRGSGRRPDESLVAGAEGIRLAVVGAKDKGTRSHAPLSHGWYHDCVAVLLAEHKVQASGRFHEARSRLRGQASSASRYARAAQARSSENAGLLRLPRAVTERRAERERRERAASLLPDC